MGKIIVEIETKEAQYAVNSINAILNVVDKVAERGNVYQNRTASVIALKDKIMQSMKEQSTLEDLREGIKIINNYKTMDDLLEEINSFYHNQGDYPESVAVSRKFYDENGGDLIKSYLVSNIDIEIDDSVDKWKLIRKIR